MPLLLGGHGGEPHYPHDQKDQEENYSNDQDWHTPPPRPFWGPSEPPAVIAITCGCEGTQGAGTPPESRAAFPLQRGELRVQLCKRSTQ